MWRKGRAMRVRREETEREKREANGRRVAKSAAAIGGEKICRVVSVCTSETVY